MNDQSQPTDTMQTLAVRPRHFMWISRTIRPDCVAILDAIADDGTAWTALATTPGGQEFQWRQISPLPPRSCPSA